MLMLIGTQSNALSTRFFQSILIYACFPFFIDDGAVDGIKTRRSGR